MIRALLLAAILLALPVPPAIPCWVVRKAIAQYGEAAVESWARARGVSEQDIEKAKRCLR